jgi:transcriptional regulator with XRE-family HTH domain
VSAKDAASKGAKEPKAEADGESDGWQSRLSEAMGARGLSGGELARRTGFTSQYVNSLRQGDRGARLPLETAKRLAHALGVSVEWLVKGDGPRERLSDVYATFSGPPRSSYPSDVYPSRAEAIALLSSVCEPEVIAALREVVPESDGDPGRDYWIAYAKELTKTLKRIKDDPDFGGEGGGTRADHAPRSSFAIRARKK